MLNHERAAFVRLFASAVLCVAMNLWLIPRFGALGAAYGLVGAQFAAGGDFSSAVEDHASAGPAISADVSAFRLARARLAGAAAVSRQGAAYTPRHDE